VRQVRQEFLQLVQEERIEIVSGGWVMPDEANSLYTAMLDQLIFGSYTFYRLLPALYNRKWKIGPGGCQFRIWENF
jgi:alpha-mannosidase II